MTNKIRQQKKIQRWHHPGGKLRELGADKLSNAELLAILISTGTKNKSAEDISVELIEKFGSIRGLASQPFNTLIKIRGLGDVKIIRIAAAFELARRISNEVMNNYAKE